MRLIITKEHIAVARHFVTKLIGEHVLRYLTYPGAQHLQY